MIVLPGRQTWCPSSVGQRRRPLKRPPHNPRTTLAGLGAGARTEGQVGVAVTSAVPERANTASTLRNRARGLNGFTM